MAQGTQVTARVAAYARYSSDLQNPRSIDDQIARLRASIAQRGETLADDLIFSDAEVSGAVWDRPAFQRLLRAVSVGLVRAVFVEDVSRISRDSGDLARFRQQLDFYNVKLVSVADGFELDGSSGASL